MDRGRRHPISRFALALALALAHALAASVIGSAGAALPGQPDTQDDPRAAFRLVCAVDAAVPGTTLTVGIHIRHRRGYHTYWRNPGTVGLATSVEWELPAGCKAGPLLWPVPQRMKMGVYTVWGYDGEALLLTEIELPAKLPPDTKQLEIAGRVRYMACAKSCHPGSAAVSLSLPVRAAAHPVAAWPRRFAAVRAQQPQALADLWQVTAARRGDVYSLTLTPCGRGANRKPGALAFFGFDRLVSSDKPQRVRRVQRDGARLVLEMQREEFSPADGDDLRGVLHAAGGFRADGSVPVLQVDAKIVDPSAPRSGAGRTPRRD